MTITASIIISGILVLFFASFQFSFFSTTLKKMHSLYNVFPDDGEYAFKEDENGEKIIYCENHNNSELDLILDEINTYLKRNKGAVDFPIIEHKVERRYQSLYEDAISKVSFPTYIGLMGTFLGVALGLLFFNYTGGEITDEKISSLINGVLVSMITSLLGLFLTTRGNYLADSYRAVIEEKKNTFYEFIQNELLPTFGTNTAEALNKLNRTVNRFEPAFNRVISNFQTTFDRCTDSFGSEFRQSVKVISSAVKEMGSNMQLINRNVTLQQNLLDTLQSSEMNSTLIQFVSAVREIDRLSGYISNLESLVIKIQDSTSELTRVQTSYNESLELPQQVTDKLTSILNRFATFEESINKFGEELKNTETFGTVQMQLVRDLLYDVQQKSELAKSYQELEKEKMDDLYKNQLEEIDALNKRYALAIQSHADKFSELIEEFNKQITAKNSVFLTKLEDAFDVSKTHSQFEQLNKLPEIESKIASIEGLFKPNSPFINKLEEIRKSLSDRTSQKPSNTSPSISRDKRETSASTQSSGIDYSGGTAGQARPYKPSLDKDHPKVTPPKIDDETEVKEKSFIDKLKFWKK